MKYKVGFKFRPTFRGSGIDYFEVRNVTDDWVETMVYPTNGNNFPDKIERKFYDAAFEIGEYVAIR